MWSTINPVNGDIPARYGHSAVYLESDNSMLVFGGNVGEAASNDTWKFFFGMILFSKY